MSDAELPEPERIGQEIPRLRIEKPPTHRQRVADKIIWIFGIAVLGTLLGDFLLIGVLIFGYRCDAKQMEDLVTKGIVPLLTTTGTFASTLFGPLLAFILGYYFSQKRGEQRARSDGRPRQTPP